jgi:AcrR family transcriptional regulator
LNIEHTTRAQDQEAHMSEPAATQPRQRLSRQQRRAQLLDVARKLIRESGTDEFSLGRLAEHAGVTKPVVYDHFGDRAGVLAELYREFQGRQRETLSDSLRGAEPQLPTVCRLVAGAYIDCCLAEGQELADVVAALSGSSTLTQLRQEAEDAYVVMCRDALQPLAGPLDAADLHAVVGAGDALVRRTLDGTISADQARGSLTRIITAVATEAAHDAGSSGDQRQETR